MLYDLSARAFIHLRVVIKNNRDPADPTEMIIVEQETNSRASQQLLKLMSLVIDMICALLYGTHCVVNMDNYYMAIGVRRIDSLEEMWDI
jgi:hypothetical protein